MLPGEDYKVCIARAAVNESVCVIIDSNYLWCHNVKTPTLVVCKCSGFYFHLDHS